jgi:DNA-binding NarL/FixJ family response regulator
LAIKTTPKVLRVLVADDAAVVRAGLVAMLAELPGVQVVGAAEDGARAVALAARTRPDLVLMDLQMPELNGLEATRMIRAKFPAVRVIMITFDLAGHLMVTASRDAGADGFIMKENLGAELPGLLAQLFPGHAAGAGEDRP